MLQAKQAKRQAIEVALVEAVKGEFITQEAMNSWVDSWDTDNELPIPESGINTRQQ